MKGVYLVKMIVYRLLTNPNAKPPKWKHAFVNKKGDPIQLGKNEIELVRSYKIPPAYLRTAINLNSSAKVWAIGIDRGGKKQYIYNPRFIQERSKEKYCHLVTFGKCLPRIKQHIDRLIADGDIHDKDVLNAVVLKIILVCHFRVGNNIGVDKYSSFGVTTLLNKHAVVNGDTVQIVFHGKRQVLNECSFHDKHIARILKKLKTGKRADDQLFDVTSSDINEYLKQFDECLSSKFFRTWNANVLFLKYLHELGKRNGGDGMDTVGGRKKLLKMVIERVAHKLHHTVAICRKAYIHGELQELFVDDPRKFVERVVGDWKSVGGLSAEEHALVRYLEKYGGC